MHRDDTGGEEPDGLRGLARADAARLAVTAAVTCAAACAAALGAAVPPLRVAGGLMLVLVLPGRALGTLLVPDAARASWLMALWTGGLSLALAVLIGLVLNLTWGLTRTSWTVSLAAVTLACLGVTAACRGRTEGAQAPRSVRESLRLSPLASGFLLGAIGLATGAVGLAVASAGWQRQPGFAQLWLVPAKSAATATLGVRNDYPHAETFGLTLRGGTAATLTWTLPLAAGQAWGRTVPAPAGRRLTARLTTPGQAQSVEVTP